MADNIGQHETSDNLGSSPAYSGTATTTVASVPTVAGNIISGASIWNDGSVPLQVSFDNGTTFHDHDKKAFFSHNIKGEITQLQVKTASGTAAYRILLNLEDV